MSSVFMYSNLRVRERYYVCMRVRMILHVCVYCVCVRVCVLVCMCVSKECQGKLVLCSTLAGPAYWDLSYVGLARTMYIRCIYGVLG